MANLYITATGENIYSYADDTSNALAIHINNTSNALTININNTSNWIRNTSNELALYVKEESNVLRTYINNRTYVPTFGDYYPSTIYVPTPPYFIPAPLPMIEASQALLYLTGSTIENYKTTFQNVGYSGDMLKLFDKTHQILQQHEVHFSESILSAQLFNEYQNAKTTANSTAIGAQQVEIDAMAKVLAGNSFFTGFNTVYNVGSFVKDAIDYFSLDSNGKLTEMATFEEDIWYNFHREPIHNTNLENMTSVKVNSSNLDATVYNPTGTGITRVGGTKSKYSYLYSFGVSPNNYLNILKDYFPEKKQLLLRWESKFSISFWVSFKQPEGFRPFTFLHAFDNQNTYIKVYYSGLSFRFLIFDNWGVMLVSSSFFYPIVLNQTYHIVYTYEYQSSRSVKLYIDGILKNITIISSASTLDWFDLQYNSLQITALYQVEYMQIEDYRIMPKVLTANDITQLYKIYKQVETAIDRTSNQLLLNIQNTSNWIRSSSNEISNNFKKITNDITTRVDGIVDTVVWKSMVDPLYGPFYTDLFGRLQINLDSTLFYNVATHKIGINFIAPLASPFFYDEVGFLQIGLDNTMTYDTQTRKIGVNQGFLTDKITETSNIISDRITNTSNVIINRIAETSNIISDRITNTSNVIINRIAETSNVISSRITNIDVGLSNYIRNTSNELGLTILRSSNIISDRITNVIDVGLSNYIRNTSNELGLTIARSSNIIIDRLTNVIDVGLSNYVKNTSNELGLTITQTSNIINTKIDELWLKNGNIVYNNYNDILVASNLTIGFKTTTNQLQVLKPNNYFDFASFLTDYSTSPYEILYYQPRENGLYELRSQTLNNFPQNPPPREYDNLNNKYFCVYGYGYSCKLKDSAELNPFFSFTIGISLKFEAVSKTMQIFKVYRTNGTNATLTFNIETTYNIYQNGYMLKFYSYTSNGGNVYFYTNWIIDPKKEYFIQWTFKTEPHLGATARQGFLKILIDNVLLGQENNIPMPVDDRLNEIWIGDDSIVFRYSDVMIIKNLYLTPTVITANVVNKRIYDAFISQNTSPSSSLLGTTYIENLIYTNMYLDGKVYYTNNKSNFVSQTPSTGKISIQDTGTRRTFYVDEVKVNGTNNLENQTNNSGYLYYSDGNTTTSAQVKSVSYNELTNKPTNFQSDWNSTIINKPTIFDGTWTSLSGKPTNFQSDWNSTIINKPTLTSSQWTTSGLNIYYNSGSVGIGTVNPSATYKLDVVGQARISSTVNLMNGNNDGFFTNNQILLGWNGSETYRHSVKTRHSAQDQQNAIDFYVWKGGQLSTDVGATHGMSITAGGVGIGGKTTPSYALDVIGSVNISTGNTYKINGLNHTHLWSEIIGEFKTSSTINLLNGNFNTSFINNQILLGYFGTEGYRHAIKTRHHGGIPDNQNAIDFYVWKGGQLSTDVGATHGMSITAGGVGIGGKTTPAYALDVIGSVNISTGNTYKINGLNHTHSFSEIIGEFKTSSTANMLNGNANTVFTNNQILFGYSGSETYRHAIKTRHQSGVPDNQNAIDFYVWKGGQLSTDVGATHGMSITAGGVGIGNTAPVYQLDVSNDINYTGTLRKSGTDILATKQATITGGATTITTINLTPNKALVSDSFGKVAVSTVSDTELGYLSGVSSAIQTQLNGKSDTTHTHAYSSLTGIPTSFAPSAHTHLWADITDKPTTFAPSTHTHAYSSLTGIPTSFAPSAHTHLWADITDKPTTFAPSPHTHLWADITDKPTTFAPSAHTHAYSSLTGIPTTFAPSAHTHLWADITDKPTTFAPSAHTHAYSSLTGIPTTFTPSAHTHLWADITDKPTTFPDTRWTSGTGLIYLTSLTDKVGIGTTNPSTKLDVNGNTNITGNISLTTTGNANFIEFNTDSYLGRANIAGSLSASSAIGDIVLRSATGKNLILQSGAGNGILNINSTSVGIGKTNPSANNKLEVQGVVNIHGGSPYAVPNKNIQAGSLVIGNTTTNYLYTGDQNWATTDTGCLMLECADNTEIVVHDAGQRLSSFMCYEGGATNRIQIGRTLGWGAISTTTIWGNVGIGTLTPSYKLDVNGDTRTLGRLIINNSTDGGNTRGIMMWDAGDTNWGIYMASPGAGKSFSGGNACSGAGGFTAHAIRIRTHDSVNSGFIYENGSENCLFSVRANDGLTYHSGSVGIGKTPSYKLDISGDANISGAYRVNGVPILEKYEFNWGSIAGYGSVTMLPSTIIGNTSAADGLYSYYIYETSTPTSQIFAFGTICFWANGGYCNIHQGSARFITTNHNGNNYFVIVNDTNTTRSYNMKLTKLSSYI